MELDEALMIYFIVLLFIFLFLQIGVGLAFLPALTLSLLTSAGILLLIRPIPDIHLISRNNTYLVSIYASLLILSFLIILYFVVSRALSERRTLEGSRKDI